MIKVGIFMGGPSLEREVSFNSGRTIFDYLDRHIYIPIPLFMTEKNKLFILPWQFIYRGKISDFYSRLETEATPVRWEDLPNIIDFAYLALHGFLGEDGSIQGLLTILGIPFSGSSLLANAISVNKHFVNRLLSHYNINIPEEIIKKKDASIEGEIYSFYEKNKKLIVKPNQEGSSLGITIVESSHDLEEAICKAEHIHSEYTQDVILQEYIDGQEFSIIAIEENNQWKIFEPTEIAKDKNFIFTYNQKYLPGNTIKYTPGRFSFLLIEKIKNIVLEIIHIIKPNDIIRIDGIIENRTNKIYIIDINSFPGTAPSSFVFLQGALAGLSPIDIINIIIDNGLKRHHKNKILSKKNNTETHPSCLPEKKIRIGVLLGGNSNEKEISLESGRNVYYKLSKRYFEATPIFVTSKNDYYGISLSQIVKDTTHEIESTLDPSQKILLSDFDHLFDFIFIGLHGGEGENGILQEKLEAIKIPYNGSNSYTSSLCMNKKKTLDTLDGQKLYTTERIIIRKDGREIESEKKYVTHLLEKYKKIIIKPNDDGCSAFVSLTDTVAGTLESINSFFLHSQKEECLIEGALNGIEITVGVIGNHESITCFPITQTVKSDTILSLEEKFLPGAGENITPAPFDQQTTDYIKEQITKCYRALGCKGYSRIDCFWMPQERRIVFIECNTLPALTPATCLFHQASELALTPVDLINYIVYLGFSEHNPAFTLPTIFMQTIDRIKNHLHVLKKKESLIPPLHPIRPPLSNEYNDQFYNTCIQS